MMLLAVAITLPTWLELHPGAKPQTQTSPGLIEVSYSAPAKPAEAAEHFRPLFAARQLAFAPNADGIGLSARVAAPECDLLLQFHPNSAGSVVRIHCAERTAAATSAAPLPMHDPVRPSPPGARPFPGKIDMSRFDQPVSARSVRESFYNNDAPPLEWPAWLNLHGARRPANPTPRQKDGGSCLLARYETAEVPMSQFVAHYENLLKSYGYEVARTNLQTGQSFDGRVQNRTGRVEGSLSSNGRVGGPRTLITAHFDRSVLNGPIAVRLEVCVKGSFGNR